MFLWLRRSYQAVFLLFFLFLVFASTSQFIRGYDVQWFLEIDPLVALTTALSSHVLHHALLWSLPLIVLTLVFGRFFCSWMCPMGVLHHLLGHLGRKRKVLQRVEQNAPRSSHKIKYAVLAVMLGLAAAGSVQIGLLDPIASTWRGLSVSVLPAASNTAYGLYQGERHFQWGTLITIVFFGALALNFVYPRFYCRVLCPLGAFLGLLSKFSLFRISKDPSQVQRLRRVRGRLPGRCRSARHRARHRVHGVPELHQGLQARRHRLPLLARAQAVQGRDRSLAPQVAHRGRRGRGRGPAHARL
jgi:polyferredoxin